MPIYCDHHATTPVDPAVLSAMLPFFTEHFGNPASTHAADREVKRAVDHARDQLASALNAHPSEIIFTSGATEANNLAIKGIAEAYCDQGQHLVTVATEHRAVLEPMEYLGELGFEVTVLPVQRSGLVDLEELEASLRSDTILLSVMAANNEIGVVQPLAEIGQITRQKGVLFHTDAAQAVGKIPLDVEAMSIDLMSLTAHKIYGPKGIGALYVRRQPKVKLSAQIHGGGQERNWRSGTLNVPLIVGFGVAVELASERMEQDQALLEQLRDHLWKCLSAEIPGIRLNGTMEARLAGNLNVSFPGIEGTALLVGLGEEVAVSTGSACAGEKVSHVLTALGHSEDLARASLRFGLGRGNTLEEIEQVAERVIEVVQGLRQLSGFGVRSEWNLVQGQLS